MIKAGRLSYLLLVIPSLLWLVGCAATGDLTPPIPERPDQLGNAPVHFKMPQPERIVMENGLVVYYLYDDELPMVSANLYLAGGAIYEPGVLAGLAGAVGAEMRDGGIPGMPPDLLDKKLNSLAAHLETQYGGEFGSASFSCLSEDFNEVFYLFSQVVRYPQFSPERFELWRALTLDGIKRRRDDPATMAAMTFNQLLYGADSPFAREATSESIRALRIEHLRGFHSRFVRPDGAILAISGAIPRERLISALQDRFGSWQGRAEDVTTPDVLNKPTPGIYVLNRDFDQATIILGHLGPPRFTPDIYALTIFNRLYGAAGFESPPFSEVRSRLGLAYAVSGAVSPGLVAGSFEVSLGTRVPESGRAVNEVLRLTREAREQPPTETRERAAQDAIKQSFVFKFADSSAIVNRKAVMEKLGYPEDFDASYLDRISAVSPTDVLNVAKRWVVPDDAVIVAVGRLDPELFARGISDKLPFYVVDFDTHPVVRDF